MVDQFDAPSDTSVRKAKYDLFENLGISENLVGEELNCDDTYIKLYAERNRDPTGSKRICGGLSSDDMSLNAQQKKGLDGSITKPTGEIVTVKDMFVYIFSPYDKTKEKLVCFA